MRILIACEFSGITREAFKRKGHYALSCDLLPTEISGEHYQGDVRHILNDGWDMMIAFPPCTYLTYAGIRYWKQRGRKKLREEALEFFLELYNADIQKICVENPQGYPNTVFRKPDQIIHPYFFGDPFLKRTCLWLKNLPKLDYSKTIIQKPEPLYISNGEKTKGKKIHFTEGLCNVNVKDRSKIRSKTFNGIASAIAEKWG